LLFLGTFAELREASVSAVISVSPAVRLALLGSHWADFHKIWYLSIFQKYVERNQVSLKSEKNEVYFT
jgi:hypothetical protein